MIEDFFRAISSKIPAKRERLLEPRISNYSPNLKSFPFYKAQILLPSLGDTWMAALDERLQRPNGITTAALISDHVQINPDLGRLSPGAELNDAIVNGYLILVREAFSNPKRYCLATTRLFTPNVCLGLVDRLVNAETLQNCEGIIIPLHQARHWTFVVLRYTQEKISFSYYDSLVSSPSPVPIKLVMWVKSTFPGIHIQIETSWGPQQRLENDCGVIMLIGMRLIAAGRPHLSQDEADEIIPICRHRILAELLAGQLDPKPEDYDLFLEREQSSARADDLVTSFENFPGRFSYLGATIEDGIPIDDSPIETPLGSTGDGEIFMGAAVLSDVMSPVPPVVEIPETFWLNQFSEFED